MNLSDKFKEYFKESGRLQTWFAKKLGLSVPVFYNMTNGRHKIPKRLWIEIIERTEGKISFLDLMKDEFKDHPDLVELIEKHMTRNVK